jgi:hypothetical protein
MLVINAQESARSGGLPAGCNGEVKLSGTAVRSVTALRRLLA